MLSYKLPCAPYAAIHCRRMEEHGSCSETCQKVFHNIHHALSMFSRDRGTADDAGMFSAILLTRARVGDDVSLAPMEAILSRPSGVGNGTVDSDLLGIESNASSIAKYKNLGVSDMNDATGNSGIDNSNTHPKSSANGHSNNRPKTPTAASIASNMVSIDLDDVFFDYKPLTITKWDPDMELHKESVKTIPIWIRFPNLELKYWGSKCLHKHGDSVRTTFKINQIALNKERLAYARLLVEVGLNRDLPSNVCFQNEKGICMKQTERLNGSLFLVLDARGMGMLMISAIKELLYDNLHDAGLIPQECQANKLYEEGSAQYCSWLQQKEKIHWLQAGHSNSKVFYNSLKTRTSKNTINRLMINQGGDIYTITQNLASLKLFSQSTGLEISAAKFELYCVGVDRPVVDHGSSYSIKKVYELLRAAGSKVHWDKAVWRSSTIPKHQFLTWLAVKQRLLTRDRLVKLKLNSMERKLRRQVFCAAVGALVYTIWKAKE
ncbi:Glutamyl-tRNA(Gln) amidotransferase subunit A [Bienertia sinuspersici]